MTKFAHVRYFDLVSMVMSQGPQISQPRERIQLEDAKLIVNHDLVEHVWVHYSAHTIMKPDFPSDCHGNRELTKQVFLKKKNTLELLKALKHPIYRVVIN